MEFRFCVGSCTTGEIFGQFDTIDHAELFCEGLFNRGVSSYVYDSRDGYTICEYEI